ncbi:MAG: VOC family protein [Candidatus Methylomirabilales bacterium]
MENRIGTLRSLVFLAKEIRRTYEELKGRGVEFTEGPARQPWRGTLAQFLDQNGNTFVLVDG